MLRSTKFTKKCARRTHFFKNGGYTISKSPYTVFACVRTQGYFSNLPRSRDADVCLSVLLARILTRFKHKDFHVWKDIISLPCSPLKTQCLTQFYKFCVDFMSKLGFSTFFRIKTNRPSVKEGFSPISLRAWCLQSFKKLRIDCWNLGMC